MRQDDTPSRSGSAPRSTIALSAACWPSLIQGRRPERGWSRRPSTPSALKRITQSRSVCRSIPAAWAAAFRLMPSSTLASAIRRAATRPSRSRRAKRRSSAASRSVRIASGAPIPCPPSDRKAGNHGLPDTALHGRVSSSHAGYETACAWCRSGRSTRPGWLRRSNCPAWCAWVLPCAKAGPVVRAMPPASRWRRFSGILTFRSYRCDAPRRNTTPLGPPTLGPGRCAGASAPPRRRLPAARGGAERGSCPPPGRPPRDRTSLSSRGSRLPPRAPGPGSRGRRTRPRPGR
jgi:hypothetical protein